jgi:DNA polymerase III delta subunit
MFESHIKHNSFLLFGDDSFRLGARLASLKNSILKSSKSVSLVKASPKDDLQSIIFGVSLFADFKLILIDLELFDLELISEIMKEGLPESVKIILFKSGKFDKRLKAYKALEKLVDESIEIEQFSPWKTADILNWVKGHAAEQQIKIEPIALQKLVEYFGANTALISSELIRLNCYMAGGLIKKEQVQELCQSSDNLFDLADLLLYGKLPELTQKIKKLSDFQNSLALVAGLQTVFRAYLTIKSLEDEFPAPEIARLTGKNPWKIGQDLNKLANISFENLLLVVRMLNQIEEEIKTGQSFDPDLQLRFRILSLAGFK